jgi:hypothetical protein
MRAWSTGAAAAAWVLAASAGMTACSKSATAVPKPIPIKPIAAPAVMTVTGLLELPAGEQLHTSVIADGKRLLLVLSPNMIDALGPGARTPGAQVRVTGEPATLNGAPAIRVTSIALVPR